MLSEQQFSDASEIGFDFKLLINSGFEKSSAGTNQPPLKYFSYICGTKQVSISLIKIEQCFVLLFTSLF